MNKALSNLAREIFKEPKIFLTLGFSQKESYALYYITQGLSIGAAALKMDSTYREVKEIKNKCLPLIPFYLNQKLDILINTDLNKINSNLLHVKSSIEKFTTLYKTLQVRTIRELAISRRTKNALKAHNISDTNDLVSYKKEELFQVKNLGPKGLLEIEQILSELSLKLKG